MAKFIQVPFVPTSNATDKELKLAGGFAAGFSADSRMRFNLCFLAKRLWVRFFTVRAYSVFRIQRHNLFPFYLCFFLLLIAPAALAAQSPTEIEATVIFVQKLQCSDGGFAPAPVNGRPTQNPKGSLRATLAALRALKYFDGPEYGHAAAKKFVSSCYDSSTGAFSDQPGAKPDVFSTAAGLMAVAEFGWRPKMAAGAAGPPQQFLGRTVVWLNANAKNSEEIRIAAAGLENAGYGGSPQWLKDLEAIANPDGSFGKGAEKVRDTAASVVTILRLGGQPIQRTKIIDILNKGQNKDGGFGKDDSGASDLETSYWVIRCYRMLKAQPINWPKTAEFIGKCRNKDAAYGLQPGKPSEVSSTYFAAIILRWLEDE